MGDSASLSPDAPVGIFDSGLGGLTVVRAIREAVPHEDLVYLGDTARVPYGTRSPETIVRYARSCARHLRSHGLKVLVVACNTVSAVALDMLRVELDVPVLGVIEPGARAGVGASVRGRIGVLATAGTVASGAYVRAVAGIDSRAEVLARPAPLLVPLAEEGWVEGDVPAQAVRRYLAPLAEDGIDTLVLGCTHYPLLAPVIEAEAVRLCGPSVRVVDSAVATAGELASLLRDRGLEAPRAGDGALRLDVTDLPGQFADIASRFLGRALAPGEVTQVDL
jgi:glutamate racemase